jgi:hypothetical protein
LDDCIQWIVSWVETEDPNAVRLSVPEADTYLASFDDVRGGADGLVGHREYSSLA